MIPFILYHYWRAKYLAQRFRTRAELLAWQDQQVQKFLRRILPRAPFYQQQRDGRAIADWQQWPTIDKATMMANFDRLNTVGIRQADAFAVALRAEAARDFSPTLGSITVGLSSGTSGSRGLFLASEHERYRWAGVALAKVLPSSLLATQRVAFFLRANSNLYATVGSRRIRFEFFDLLDPLDRHVKRLNTLQPTVLVAPPSLLRQLAEKIGRSALRIAPQKIVSVAEVLDPLDEALIQARFGQIVHQVYQATEGFLASTCRYGTLHLHEEFVAIQKAELDPALRKFSPIITDFNRTSQPIIRYRLNDILTERATPCPCGAITTALESIEGRCDDLFYLRGATDDHWVTIFPDFIRRAVITSSPLIEAYRVRQLTADQIEVALVAPIEHQPALQQTIRNALQQLFVRLECEQPQIRFCSLTVEPGLHKLKRVERCFVVEQS